DIRKPFQKACECAGIQNLRIHDLRHMAATILLLRGIPEAIIRKLAGHRSRELERYEHLSPLVKQQTVEMIAEELRSTATDKPNFEDGGKGSEVIERNCGGRGGRARPPP